MITGNVLRHFAWQFGTGAAVTLVAYAMHADYSSLGLYAGAAQAAAALVGSMVNELLGTAPK